MLRKFLPTRANPFPLAVLILVLGGLFIPLQYVMASVRGTIGQVRQFEDPVIEEPIRTLLPANANAATASRRVCGGVDAGASVGMLVGFLTLCLHRNGRGRRSGAEPRR